MTLIAISLFIIPVIIIAGCYGIIILTIWTKRGISVAKSSSKNPGTLNTSFSKRASSRGIIPRAKVKTIKITFVIVSGNYKKYKL